MAEPHVLFMVHGMGKAKAGWTKEEGGPIPILAKAMETYPALQQDSFEDWFHPVEVRYDDAFEQYRKMWKESTEDLVKMLDPLAEADKIAKVIRDVAKSMEKPNSDDFLWTHVLDVVLYRFFPIIREDVERTVARAIVDGLNAAGGASRVWSVMGYSLGSSVTHNTLARLYTGGVPSKGDVYKGDALGKPHSITLIANVSRVLQRQDLHVFSDVVHPSQGGICRYYLSARHMFDPLTKPYPSRPSPTNPRFANPKRYLPLAPASIYEINVHDLGHYLRDPEVHGAMFQTMIGKDFLTDDQLALAKSVYNGAVPDETAHRNKLEPIFASEVDDWTAFVKAALRYIKVI
ncbi:MAG: hypothetical protein HQ523_03115 [Lentisphaerae bacterium]|nr:hypothetical protein [Lentisphaerota bacterium]